MAQKLWEKSVRVNDEIDRFTVGRDREMDLYLAKHDVLGSMAHITMLESIGLLTAGELQALLAGFFIGTLRGQTCKRVHILIFYNLFPQLLITHNLQ